MGMDGAFTFFISVLLIFFIIRIWFFCFVSPHLSSMVLRVLSPTHYCVNPFRVFLFHWHLLYRALLTWYFVMIVHYLPIRNYVFTTYRFYIILFPPYHLVDSFNGFLFSPSHSWCSSRWLCCKSFPFLSGYYIVISCHFSYCFCFVQFSSSYNVFMDVNAHAYTGHKQDSSDEAGAHTHIVYVFFGWNMNELVANGCQLILPYCTT